MGKDTVFKIVGLVMYAALGIAGIIVQSKKKMELSDKDKEDIANQIAAKIKPAPKPKAEVVKQAA